MIGTQTMKLTRDSVNEALEEYVNRHLAPEHRCKVTGWLKDTYGDSIEVTMEPSKPTIESLSRILQSEDATPVVITADGSIAR